MNKKAQRFSFIAVIFIALFFIVMFALGLAPMVTALLGGANLTVLGGFGSWVASNLNVWFFMAFIIGIFALLAWGFGGQE